MTDLADAVDDLTLPRNVKVQTDTGHTWATEDPLLVQLEEAIHSTMSRTGGRGGGDSRMILDADALMRFSQISSVIGDWCRMVRAHVSRNATDDLRAWHDAYSQTPGERMDEFYVTQMRKWADQIRGKLTPRVTVEYLHPCPECEETDWANEDGRMVPYPVVIDYEQNAPFESVRWSCRACGTIRDGQMAVRALVFEAETRNRIE